jgi:hypothetical protein
MIDRVSGLHATSRGRCLRNAGPPALTLSSQARTSVLRNQMVVMNNGKDLSADWTFRLSFLMSVANPGVAWDVGAATVETVYLP